MIAAGGMMGAAIGDPAVQRYAWLILNPHFAFKELTFAIASVDTAVVVQTPVIEMDTDVETAQ